MQRKIKGSAGLGDLKDTLNGKPIRNHLTGIPAGSEGLCGPRAPAPKAFGLWTPIAELAYRWYPSWFPHKREGTRKPGMAAFGFWPGGEAANPDALHPGKAWEQSAGESLLSPSDFPWLSWARSPQTFRSPSAAGGRCWFFLNESDRPKEVQELSSWRRSGGAEPPA